MSVKGQDQLSSPFPALVLLNDSLASAPHARYSRQGDSWFCGILKLHWILGWIFIAEVPHKKQDGTCILFIEIENWLICHSMDALRPK